MVNLNIFYKTGTVTVRRCEIWAEFRYFWSQDGHNFICLANTKKLATEFAELTIHDIVILSLTIEPNSRSTGCNPLGNSWSIFLYCSELFILF